MDELQSWSNSRAQAATASTLLAEPPEDGTPERPEAHAALARVLPELERSAVRLLPARRARRAIAAREDLVQFAALVALSALEAGYRTRGKAPPWWRSDAQLCAYLRGVLQRGVKRMLRDAAREVEDSLTLEWLPARSEPAPLARREERRRVRTCLAGVRVEDLRLLARFGQGRGYEELAPLVGSNAGALAKRRVRTLAGLRERCRSCSHRRENGCSWVRLDWLVDEREPSSRR